MNFDQLLAAAQELEIPSKLIEVWIPEDKYVDVYKTNVVEKTNGSCLQITLVDVFNRQIDGKSEIY